MKISAFIIAYNEYYRIMQCVSSLIGNVDQIVLVDDGSSLDQKFIYSYFDEILPFHGIEFTLIEEEHKGSHALHLDAALNACDYDWVFQLDADEVLVTPYPQFFHAVIESEKGDIHGVECDRVNYVQNGNVYEYENREPKKRLFHRESGYFPKEHGVEWVFNLESLNICFNDAMLINHYRTKVEKRQDSMNYFRNYIKEYQSTEDKARKKYYYDKFDAICSYYGFPFKSIDEAIGKGVDECIRIVKLQWD